jgi:transcriptional regulator with XRE-family HTH domain
MEPTPQATEPAESPTQALLKRLRGRGLSQSEISRRTSIPQPRLSRWESGDVATGADDALKLQALEQELDAAGTQQG